MTPATVEGVLRVLRGTSRKGRINILSIPQEALQAVGVTSTEDLSLVVGDGELILRPSKVKRLNGGTSR